MISDDGGNLVDSNSGIMNIVPAGGTVGPSTTGWETSGFFDGFIGLRGYAGVAFFFDNSSPHFGFLDIELNSANDALTIYGRAYDSTPGIPITTPSVPEPSSILALAIGATAICLRRRKRK